MAPDGVEGYSLLPADGARETKTFSPRSTTARYSSRTLFSSSLT